MSARTQHTNILYAVLGFVAVVIIVAAIGFLALDRDPDIIQGQVEVSEYRVSSKVPGRILEIRVKEGDFVKAGDTLAILDAPEVRAKMEQARSAENAASALELKAQNGARKEQIQGAFSVYQQAKAGFEVAEKSYQRIQRLFDEGVVSAPESVRHGRQRCPNGGQAGCCRSGGTCPRCHAGSEQLYPRDGADRTDGR